MRHVLGLSIALPFLFSFAVPARGGEPYRVIYPKQDRAVAAALAKPAALDHSESLRDVLGEIADDQKVDVIIDEVGLTDAGVDIDVHAAIDIEGVDLATAFGRVLEPHDLTYFVENGALVVTTPGVAADQALVRAYDVASLLDSEAKAAEVAEAVSRLATPSPSAESSYREVRNS